MLIWICCYLWQLTYMSERWACHHLSIHTLVPSPRIPIRITLDSLSFRCTNIYIKHFNTKPRWPHEGEICVLYKRQRKPRGHYKCLPEPIDRCSESVLDSGGCGWQQPLTHPHIHARAHSSDVSAVYLPLQASDDNRNQDQMDTKNFYCFAPPIRPPSTSDGPLKGP